MTDANNRPKIIVLTPIRNEDWILDRFLAVTSRFADHIVIADQASSDCSVCLCRKYPKVVLIENKSQHYDEAERQLLLIRTARALVPGPRILLALDADEILAADATSRPGWQTMLDAKPGTILFFEKPDLYVKPSQSLRYDIPWPIGYMDDGSEHRPKKIHSIRIPMPEDAPRLALHDIKIIHYAFARYPAQQAKIRLYSVLENALGITPSPLKRRRRYRANTDYLNTGVLEPTPAEWFRGWEEVGIDMQTIHSRRYYWQDIEVLRHFHEYGVHRFFHDDIWAFDWEACRLYAKSQRIEGIPDSTIKGPPVALMAGWRGLDACFDRLVTIKYALSGRKPAPDWL